MSSSVKGRLDWSLKRDADGHRDYSIEWLVGCTDVADGPLVVLSASGLPAIGATWVFGNDNDPWAFCLPTCNVKPVLTREPGVWWVVEQTFSTKPLKRCQTTSIENPLLEPAKLSGTFAKYTKEATKDRNGNPIKSSSHELIKGKAVEVDDSRPGVQVSLNSLTLPLSTIAPMIDTVNDAMLWGLVARKIKLSNAPWSRQLYGTCTFYYTITYEFEINDSALGWDRKILDEGTKVLAKGGNKDNPRDFVVYKDRNGENTRVLLDGNGAAITDIANAHYFDFEYYEESDFTTLGIPASL